MNLNWIRPLAGAALALGLGASPARAERARPTPEALLESAIAGPLTAFAGRMMVTTWYGSRSRAEEVEIYRSPSGLSRREFLAPDGSVERLIVSDGEREEVRLPRQGKILRGDAVKSYEKLLGPKEELRLLMKNYELKTAGQEAVAGRSAWILQIKPRVRGKPWQKLWVDPRTGAVLANKRYLPGSRHAALSRFTRFEPRKRLDPNLFTLAPGTAAVAGELSPDFMSLEQLKEAAGVGADFPRELPEGFVFESADFFKAAGHAVRHARYTDGLAVLSLFQTDRPVSLPRGTTFAAAPAPKGAQSLRISSSGKVLTWKRGKRHFTLMGDLSRELLRDVSAGLR